MNTSFAGALFFFLVAASGWAENRRGLPPLPPPDIDDIPIHVEPAPQKELRGTSLKRATKGESLLCTDPYRAICEAEGSIDRREKIRRQGDLVFSENRRKVISSLLAKESKDGKALTDEDFLGPSVSYSDSGPTQPEIVPPKVVPRYKQYVEALYDGLGADAATTQKTFEVLRVAMTAHFEKVLAAAPANRFPAREVALIQAKLATTQVVASGKELVALLAGKGGKEAYDESFLDKYLFACTRGGSRAMAFYWEADGKSYAVVCPGLLARATQAKAGNVREFDWDSLAHILGHEAGHSIDSQRAPALTQKYLACLFRVGGEWGGINERTFTNRFGKELSADYWGGVALADRMAKEKDPRKRSELAIRTFESGCSVKDETGPMAIHPPKRQRFKTSLSRHPVLGPLLGCAPTGEECTL